MAVHDALGDAGGAAGEHDEQRVLEGDAAVFDRCRTVAGQVGPQHGVGDGGKVGLRVEVGDDHGFDQRRHLRDDFGILGQAIDLLAVVPVAVDADQHLGFDLAEAVEHALHAEVGRGRRPDRAERGGGEHRGQGFGQVGQVAGDPVAGFDAGGEQALLEAGDFTRQFGAAEAALDLVLAPEDQGFACLRRGRAGFPQN